MLNLSTSRLPLVTVIIPAHNYAHFISSTLASVQAQTYQDWECIVVDDGSTDNTEEVVARVAESDPRIHYLRQDNLRQAAARNTGIAHARGDYFQFLDADDLIEPRKLELQVAHLEQHPQIDLTYSSVRYFTGLDKGERLLSRQYSSWDDAAAWMPEISGPGSELLLTLIRNNIMVVNSPLLRRRVIDRVARFDVDLTPVEDWEYLIRCAAANLIFAFNDFEEGRAIVRSHPQSSSRHQPHYLRAVLKMRQKVALMNIADDARELNRLKIAETRGQLGVEEVADGKLVPGISQMWKAAWADPRPRFRAKWLICAASAPFVGSHRLKRMVTSSLTGSIKKLGASQA